MIAVKDPDKIRDALTRVAGERDAADKAHKKATAELRRLVRDARESDELTDTEAAKLAGISRFTFYELLKD
jgi:hypothetical protein